nr:MAG TPA: hypothetical protein [Caudoviricetes sp.]
MCQGCSLLMVQSRQDSPKGSRYEFINYKERRWLTSQFRI